MKRKINICVTFIMVLCLVLSATALADSTVKKVTLQQALDTALTDNLSVQNAEEAVDMAAVQKKQAANAAKSMRKVVDTTPSEYLYAAMDAQDIEYAMNVSPKQADIAYDIAVLSLDLQKDVIKLSTETQYWSLWLAGREESLAYDSLQRAQKQLSDAQAKYRVGTASKFEVMQAELAEKQALAELNDKRVATKAAKRQLCATLNWDIDTDVSPSDTMQVKEYKVENRTELAAGLLEESTAWQIQKLSHEIDKISFDHEASVNPSNTFAYKIAEAKWNQKQIAFQQSENDLKIAIEGALDNLQNNYENYQTMSAARETMAEAYRLASLQYREGLITFAELLTAEENLKQMEYAELGLLFAYNTTVNQLEYNLLSSTN